MTEIPKDIKITKLDMVVKKPRKKQVTTRGLGKKRYKVDVAECYYCHDIIFSRARHDMRFCTCKHTYVDGGLEYFKVGWTGRRPYTFSLFILENKRQLYDDWNTMADKLGLMTRESARNAGYLRKLYRYEHPNITKKRKNGKK